MKIPLLWLSEFVDVGSDVGFLCERLTMGGFEVEGVEEIGQDLAGVLVGEIVSTAPHPESERLTVCAVRGGEATETVVCGATNMKAGDRVAFAPVGAMLPGGRRIERTEIRGVMSNGMLCSEAELGLSDDASGILLLDADATLGKRLTACLGFEGTVLDVAVTPNRGDCLSVMGIAREVAALTGATISRARINVRERGSATGEAVRVRIDDPSGCGRYAGRLLRNVRVGPSPLWLQLRLRAVGLRPINNVVDVTNLVMIERGQPLHAFDFERLPEPEIVVRRAGSSPLLRTLDGVDRSLAPGDLLITSGDEPIALAGVMGGESTEVSGATTTVLLEAAWFDPATVRRTARRLELRSEAAYRFERGVDIGGVSVALDRAAALLRQICGAEVAPGVVEAYPALQAPAPIRFRPKKVLELVGLDLPRPEMTATLKALGMSVAAGAKGTLTVVPPSYRSDLGREIDVIEEIARVVGYARIPTTLPSVRLGGAALPERQRWMREVKRILAGMGLTETISLSFTSARMNEIFPGLGTNGTPVALLNPLSRDESELRLSLLAGLLGVWRHNRNQGASGIAAFSVGKVYWSEEGTREGWRLAGVLAGGVPLCGLGRPPSADFADVKGIVESVFDCLHLIDEVDWQRAETTNGWAGGHPGKTAVIRRGPGPVGIAGALHPDVEAELGIEESLWVFELDLENLLPYVPPRQVFRGLPRFPAVVRDLAIVVGDDFASDRVIRFVKSWRQGLVEEILLFDEYSGAPIPEGKKSLAYSISYRAADRTLTDEEVNTMHAELIDALCRELPIEIR